MLVGSYGWPECYDRLHIWGEKEAIAARLRSDADEVVWSYQDGALSTIQALLELPDPDEPGARPGWRGAHRPGCGCHRLP